MISFKITSSTTDLRTLQALFHKTEMNIKYFRNKHVFYRRVLRSMETY
jgi:hypothetical protein